MKRFITTSRGEILIRAASPADATEFRELRLSALQDSPTAFSADYQTNLHYPLKHWEEMLTTHADESTILLAEHKRSAQQSGSVHEKNLIGTASVARGGSPKSRHSVWIWSVYVEPEWRGLHIAEELIRSCFTWAKARKIVIAKLGVTAINKSAVHCYERCGFKIYGTEPRALFYNGTYYDFHLMSCSLLDES